MQQQCLRNALDIVTTVVHTKEAKALLCKAAPFGDLVAPPRALGDAAVSWVWPLAPRRLQAAQGIGALSGLVCFHVPVFWPVGHGWRLAGRGRVWVPWPGAGAAVGAGARAR